jgi:single-stranded-DNA-specific exonuclease
MSDQAILQAADQATELVMIIELPDCPVGLVGLVAGKVSAEYQRPTFVITQANGEISGSGRSIEHFNLVEGMQSMDELFTKYGGHPMACGFSLTGPDALRAFKQRFRQLAAEQLAGKDLRKQLKIDMELPLAGADWSVVDVLEQCAPYGQANPKPVFMARQVEIITVSKIGKRQDHARLTISQDGTIRQCIGFGFGAWADALQIGDRVDIAYYLSVNEWNGNRNLQLVIQDIRS